jgi:OCT family organic cation transporter-like MFS transporter 4/5
LKGGAKCNDRTLPSDDELLEMMQAIKEDEEDKKEEETRVLSTSEKIYEVFDEILVLVKTPEMRKRTLNVFYSWLIVAMVYYGLSFNSKNLSANRYISSFISGFV